VKKIVSNGSVQDFWEEAGPYVPLREPETPREGERRNQGDFPLESG
jgi:hypothetical protein